MDHGAYRTLLLSYGVLRLPPEAAGKSSYQYKVLLGNVAPMQPIYRIIPLLALVLFVSGQSAPFNIAVSMCTPGSLIQLYITLFSAQPLINVYIDINSPFKVVTGSTVHIQQLSAGVLHRCGGCASPSRCPPWLLQNAQRPRIFLGPLQRRLCD